MTIAFYLILWALGAIFGSFASAVLPRLHEKKDFVSERSACPKCWHELGFFDLFPIFSYLFLGGKCRYCKAKIPTFHVLLEISMVLMFLLIGFYFGNPEAYAMGDFVWMGELGYLLVAGFVTISFCAYDLMYLEIPDEFLLSFLVLAFVWFWYLHITGGNIGYMIPLESPLFASPLMQAMAGFLPIFLFFLTLIIISGGRWMGAGDLRIAVFMGFVWGAKIAWLGIFLSYFVGSIIGVAILLIRGREHSVVPFGPFLAIGLWLAMFEYQRIMEWYLQLILR